MAVRLRIISTNRGLTLLEVLIATTLSVLVLAGLYSAISASLNTEEVINQSLAGINEYTGLTELFQRDIRTMVSGPGLSQTPRGPEFSFTTTHSLLYNSTRLVQVTYYSAEIDGKTCLFRKELAESGQNPLTIRLLEDIKDLKFYSKTEEGWVEKIHPGSIIKMSYSYKNNDWEIIAGRIL